MDSEWFKQRKAELGLNDTQIGEAVGRDRSVGNRLVHGKVNVGRQHIVGLARVFEVSPSEIAQRAGLIEGEGAPVSEDEIAEILAEVQAQMPATLPHAEWPRYVAAALKMRLDMLSDDRSKAGKPGRPV